MATTYKYLKFFDKNGDDLNFEYGSTGLWTGRMFFPEVSTSLIENCEIFILEELLPLGSTGSTAVPELGKPHISVGATGGTNTVIANWETDETDEIFIYTFGATLSNPLLQKIENFQIEFDNDPLETIAPTGASFCGSKITSVITSEAIQINLGFAPIKETEYEQYLILTDQSSGNVFAKIHLYGVGIAEDERFSVMLNNFGDNISNNDFKIFQTTDINEDIPDNIVLNRKRKELLLEFQNIFNFVGSYKALINILKYFGWDNVKIKEYWQNLDEESINFGKYKQVNIDNLFSVNADFNASSQEMIPNKKFKKTSLFGLFYDITVTDGTFDDDGLPNVEETSTFTNEEVLIKLFALKNKLKSHFLPLNARIVDIVGEALYFSKYDINVWVDQLRVDEVNINIKPIVSVTPNQFGYISDLRPIQHIGCPISPDLTLGGTHQYSIYTYTIGNADKGDKYIVTDSITGNSIQYEVQTDESEANALDGLIESWRSSPNYPFINFAVYPFGATSNGQMRVVQQYETDFNFTLSVEQGPQSPSPTFTSVQHFLGATAISFYSECFMGYFQNQQIKAHELNDAPEIAVGYPVVLHNKSFEIAVEDLNITFNSLDQINVDPGVTSTYNKPLYGPYTTSFASISATGPSGSTYSTVSIPNFPYSDYNNPQGNWTINNIGRCNYIEQEWIVTCTESSTTGASGWIYDSGRISITDITNNHAIILPYPGKYRLELKMWDLFNNQAYLRTDDYFEIEMRNADIIGWYEMLDKEYTTETKRYDRDTLSVQDSLSTELTVDEYTSTLDLPFHPNEEINIGEISLETFDSVEFYQAHTNDDEPIDPKVNINPYQIDNTGNFVKIDDLYHLWSDNAGAEVTRFRINSLSLTGPSISISNPVTARKSIFNFTDLGTTGTTGFKNIINQLNTYSGASAINTNTITGSTSINTNNLFEDFIFYYGEEYRLPFGSTSTGSIRTPEIIAISKNFDYPGRLVIGMTGCTGSLKTESLSEYKTIGDIPSFFEIYSIGGTSNWFKIGATGATYTVGATNMTDLVTELNGATQYPINQFTYNAVYGASGATVQNIIKIIASDNAYSSFDNEILEFSDNIIGVNYMRSITTNPTLDSVRILKFSKELPNLIRVNFSYDNAKMVGKKNPIWTIHKHNDSTWSDLTYNSRYFSYLFTETGSYSISLSLEDTNGNINKVTKREFIRII